MENIQHKVMPVNEFKVLDDENGIAEVIVSVTGIVDRVKDIIHPGSYEKTLVQRTPKGVWSHDWTTPVSKTLEAKELMPGDPRLPSKMRNGDPWPREAGALMIKTQFNLETQRGREAYADVKFFGDQQEWSIGYQVPRDRFKIDTKTGIRHIYELDCFEYSPVLFGAMPEAVSRSVKTAQTAYNMMDKFVTEDGDFDMKAFTQSVAEELKTMETKSDEKPEEQTEQKDVSTSSGGTITAPALGGSLHADPVVPPKRSGVMETNYGSLTVAKPNTSNVDNLAGGFSKRAANNGFEVVTDTGTLVAWFSTEEEADNYLIWLSKGYKSEQPNEETKAAVKPHNTDTSDAEWDGEKVLSNFSNDAGHEVYREAFGVKKDDVEGDAVEDWALLHHEVSEDGRVGAANVKACEAIIGALNSKSDLPEGLNLEGDREAVYRHMAQHLEDAGVKQDDIPELKAFDENIVHAHGLFDLALKMYAEMEGSLEQRMERLHRAVRGAFGSQDEKDDSYTSVEATYDDRVYVSRTLFVKDTVEREQYEIAYVVNNDGTITLGDPKPVKFRMVTLPVSNGSEKTFESMLETKAGRVMASGNSEAIRNALEMLIKALVKAGASIPSLATTEEKEEEKSSSEEPNSEKKNDDEQTEEKSFDGDFEAAMLEFESLKIIAD